MVKNTFCSFILLYNETLEITNYRLSYHHILAVDICIIMLKNGAEFYCVTVQDISLSHYVCVCFVEKGFCDRQMYI